MTAPGTTIAIIDKGACAQVRVVLQSWRGAHKVSVREYSPGPVSGSFWPTNKGATLGVAKLPELIAALQAAEARVRSLGLLGLNKGVAA